MQRQIPKHGSRTCVRHIFDGRHPRRRPVPRQGRGPPTARHSTGMSAGACPATSAAQAPAGYRRRHWAGRLPSGAPGPIVVTRLGPGSANERPLPQARGRCGRGSAAPRPRAQWPAAARSLVRGERRAVYGRHIAVRDGAMTPALVLVLFAPGRGNTTSRAAASLPPSFTGKGRGRYGWRPRAFLLWIVAAPA